MDLERRFFTREIRMETGADGQRKLIGYAAVFNQLSEDLGGFREMILPGSFANVVGGDVRALFNHDPNLILGRTTARTLRIEEDDIGLRYEVDLPDTQTGRDLTISADRGDVNQSSFGFRVVPEGESWREPTDDEPLPVRLIHLFQRLYDVSPVVFPAYPQTSAEARSMAQQLAQSGATAGGRSPLRTDGRLAQLRRRLDLLEL